MKLKAVLFAAAIFGAGFFVTSTTNENDTKYEIKKQAVDKRLIRIPTNGQYYRPFSGVFSLFILHI